MPDLTQLALYLAAALMLASTPGPGIFCVAARILEGGRAEGLASICGTGSAAWSIFAGARHERRRSFARGNGREL